MRPGDEIQRSDPGVQELILYLMLQEHGAYFVSQTGSGMSGIQMEIKGCYDCCVVHIEEKPIGKYPCTCFEVGCNHKA